MARASRSLLGCKMANLSGEQLDRWHGLVARGSTYTFEELAT